MQSKFFINKKLAFAVKFIKGKVNTFFDGGLKFNTILNDTPLCFLNLDKIQFKPNYSEMYMWGGLSAAYMPENCPSGLPYGAWTFLLLHPSELIAQIVANIMAILKPAEGISFEEELADFLSRLVQMDEAAEENGEQRQGIIL